MITGVILNLILLVHIGWYGKDTYISYGEAKGKNRIEACEAATIEAQYNGIKNIITYAIRRLKININKIDYKEINICNKSLPEIYVVISKGEIKSLHIKNLKGYRIKTIYKKGKCKILYKIQYKKLLKNITEEIKKAFKEETLIPKGCRI